MVGSVDKARSDWLERTSWAIILAIAFAAPAVIAVHCHDDQLSVKALELVSAAYLVLLVVFADVIGSQFPALLSFVPALGAITATFAISGLAAPGILPDDFPPAVALVITSLVAIGLVAKLVLLKRHASRRSARVDSEGFDRTRPLPSQERLLDELIGRIWSELKPGADSPIALEGRAGEGKSFIIRHLIQRWSAVEAERRPIVTINVWQQETEADIQSVILREIYTDHSAQKHLRWLQVPVSLLAAAPMEMLRHFGASIQIRLRGVAVTTGLPELRWQAHFESVVRRIGGVVIVLDEVERAEPLVVQQVLTVARRSANIDGVAVVISFVREQVRFKAFNPLQPTITDLGSSIDATLAAFDANSGPGRSRSLLERWQEASDFEPPRYAPAAQASVGGSFCELSTRNPDAGSRSRPAEAAFGEAQLHWLRINVFANATPRQRILLARRFEEKYLGAVALRVPGLSAEDVGALIAGGQAPDYLTERIKIVCSSPPRVESAIIAAIEASINQRSESAPRALPRPNRGPPIRALLNQVGRALDAFEPTAPVEPEELAAVVVAAHGLAETMAPE